MNENTSIMNWNKDYFNELANRWDVPQGNLVIAQEVLEVLSIGEEEKILDVGCGTGILYGLLRETGHDAYTGIDISEGMLKKFKEKFKEANILCQDFEGKMQLEKGTYQYCIIFNSIPHFNDLTGTFQNAYDVLKEKGKFVIVHCRTREGLKEHHKKIGYKAPKQEPIPLDEELVEVCKEVGFINLVIKDDSYFYFVCEKI